MMTGNDKEEMHPEDMRNLMIFIVAAAFYFLAARTFMRDRYDPAAPSGQG